MNNLNQFNKEFKYEFEVQISELVSNESLATKFKKSFVNSSCSGFSTIDSKIKNSITFAKNERFLLKALKNENIKFILIPKDIECIKLDSEKLVEVKDPEMLFHRLRNRYFELKFSVVEMPDSYIGENTTIKNIDMIPKKGVYIGSNCEIGSAIINCGSIIGNNIKIGDQADIGCDDLMVIRGSNISSRHILHDNQLIIQNDSIIYSGTKIAKGIYGSDTLIGDHCNIGLNCVIGHGAKIGKKTTICSNSSIGGFSEVGDTSYLGLGSVMINRISIKNNTRVAAGSVVLKSFYVDNITILGNPGKRFKING